MNDHLGWATLRLVAALVTVIFYGLAAVGLLGRWVGGMA